MRHIDLFSGIGGNSYAADQVWRDLEHIFCEIAPFPRAVLRKHWPHAKIYENIRGNIKWESVGPIDLLTAGVPCQPASSAGQQRGTSDARWLWPETLAVVARVRPRYAILENVPNLVNIDGGMAFEDILSVLDDEDYEILPLNLPAASVGAPHLRERIWIVAHDTRELADTSSVRRIQGNAQRRGACQGAAAETPAGRGSANSPRDTEREAIRQQPELEQGSGRAPIGRNFDSESWPQAVARLCAVDDGLSRRLVRLPDGSAISGAKWRNESIKAAGNAIVPQVAVEIMRAIKAFDESL